MTTATRQGKPVTVFHSKQRVFHYDSKIDKGPRGKGLVRCSTRAQKGRWNDFVDKEGGVQKPKNYT